jgi:hypothetical protein
VTTVFNVAAFHYCYRRKGKAARHLKNHLRLINAPVGSIPSYSLITVCKYHKTICDFFARKLWVFDASLVTIESRARR